MKTQMNVKFKELVEKVHGLFQDLMSQPLRTKDNLSDIPERGIYVFYENDKSIYVGRSNRVEDRIREHSRESSTHNSATFAFNLAKEEMGLDSKIGALPQQRKELERDPEFKKAFCDAKRRVGKMEIRVMQVDDQVAQALFEIYVALALETKYNVFRTH